MLKGVSCRVLDNKVSQRCSQQGDTFLFSGHPTLSAGIESFTFAAKLPAWISYKYSAFNLKMVLLLPAPTGSIVKAASLTLIHLLIERKQPV